MTENVPAVVVSEPPHRGESVRTVALVLLALAAVTAGLYYGRDVFIPISLAAVFTALLRPPVRWLERVKLPTSVAATLVVVASLAVLAGAVLAFTAPVQTFVKDAPRTVASARAKLGAIAGKNGPLGGVLDAGPTDSAGARGAQGGGQEKEGGEGPSGVAGKVFGATAGVVSTFVEVLLLVWFLLASGTMFQRKLLRVLPLPWEKRAALDVLDQTEAVVSGYLLVTLLINLGQGAAVGLAMWLLGMPTPMLWGMMTVIAEFVPFLGGAFMVLLLAAVGLASQSSVGQALLAPGAYLLISTLQNNLVSPIAYGRRLRLNPVAVLIGVMIFWTLWGVSGAFLSVPIVATAKVLGDRLDGLSALGEFLGE
ncbi:MAG TPA: AI-2E family transporter [Longimicrobium sp.]|jgi:predicted PurR-regulated permease PerM|nr:AI-2E family transporter [Longimicrobium sp.]